MVIYGLLMVPSLTATVGQKSTDLNAHNTQTSHQVGYTYNTMYIYIHTYHIKQIHDNISHEMSPCSDTTSPLPSLSPLPLQIARSAGA